MPTFDWHDQQTWGPVLQSVSAVYLSFFPDLSVAYAPDTIQAFCAEAQRHNVERIVLLSGRGESEALRCEQIVQASGMNWTILRASWFSQNFSEGFLCDFVRSGRVALPAGQVKEPFVDADDIADVAVAALLEDGHQEKLYELTGPRLLSFQEVMSEISKVVGYPVVYEDITMSEFVASLQASQVPESMIELLEYLFSTILDGRNAMLTDGVQDALGCAPRDFSDYTKTVAKVGVWQR